MIFFAFLLQLLFIQTLAETNSTKYTWDSQLPARLQWLPNDGYCGEVSVVMATLKKGCSYYSQYDVRAISAVLPTDVQQSRFYLVGENDQRASDLLKLTYIEYDNAKSFNPKVYLAWVKKMTRAGHAVTITVFMNYYLFYGVEKKDAGEYDYDHIVSVSRVDSNYDDDLYHDDDLITMEDHGLWAPGNNPVYLFTYTFKDFIGDRARANAKEGNVYSIPDTQSGNFGIAHTGIVDKNKDCLPILLETNVNYEKPAIKNRSEERPAPMPLTLTITVSQLADGAAYNLYTYNDETAVPTESFNANAKQAISVRKIQGDATGRFVVADSIQSSDKRIYRCVRADAK